MTELLGLRLSHQQRRLWDRARSGIAARVRCLVRIRGDVDQEELLAALQDVLDRHEALRTTFPRVPGVASTVQCIAEEADLVVRRWQPAPDATSATPATSVAADLWALDTGPAFDPAECPALRAVLATAGGEHLLLLDLPALCADAASLDLLVRDTARDYARRVAFLPGEEPPYQYGAISEWQHELAEAEETAPGRDYWAALDLSLAAAPRLPWELPRAASGPEAPRPQDPLEIPLPTGLAGRLAAWEGAGGIEALLLTGWCVLLGRLAAGPDLLVGVVAGGRRYPELLDTVGPLARCLPIRLRLAPGTSFREALAEVERSQREALTWQEAFTRGTDPSPAFGFAATEESEIELAAGARFIVARRSPPWDDFGLLLHAVHAGPGWRLTLHFDPRRFSRLAACGVAERLPVLLAAALADPAAAIGDLRIAPEAERHWLGRELNDTAALFPDQSCFHQLFQLRVACNPYRVAVVADDLRVTFAVLAEGARVLAAWLVRLGVGPEVRVGLCLDRSPEALIALLAVLQAGGAYVPLDPSHPRERLALLLDDARPAVLVTRRDFLPRLPESAATSATVLCLEDVAAGPIGADADTDGRGSETDPDNLAYILYTSGSTGRPKGVQVTHRGLMNYLWWCLQSYPLDSGTGIPVHSPLTFDLTVTSLLAPLLAGRTVELLPEEGGLDGLAAALRGQMDRSLVKLTPAHLRSLEALILPGEAAGRARALVIGGEELRAEHLAFWRRHAPDTRLINEYGPTETVVGCCVHEVGPDGPESGPVPIGRPIANTRLHLLDERLQPVPAGAAGELYVGGAGVARGYLERPDLTAERFLPDPFGSPGERLYRTGDLARHLPDGSLEYGGRADFQIKLRGIRIEPGEIESALMAHPAVEAAVVVLHPDGTGDPFLAAYVVPAAGREAAGLDLELRQALRACLPEAMLPAAFVLLPALPLTAHGKVDRRSLQALPAPDLSIPTAHVPPRDALEEALAVLWAEVLGRERVGVHDNFFRLGGHSMKAAQLVARVRGRLGVELGLQDLFEAPTVAELAPRVARARRASEPAIQPAPPADSYAVSHAQCRLWFLDRQLDGASAAYNVAGSCLLAGTLDERLLERVLTALVERHEPLRTTFAEVDGAPRQVVHPPAPVPLAVVDLRAEAGADPDSDSDGDSDADSDGDSDGMARRLAREEGRTRFDLEREPPLRVRLLRLPGERSVLLFTLHHIVSDGWSMQVLMRELATLYRAFEAGEPNPLPPLRIQYKDVAAWENAHGFEAEERYWLERLAGPLEMVRLPFDLPPREVYDFAGALETATLGADAAADLRRISRLHGTTLSNVVLAAFVILLYRLTDQTDLALAMTSANRGHTGLEGLVGFFVNTLVLRLQVGEEDGFDEVLRRVTGEVHGALQHGGYPFDLLVERLNPPRRGNRQPLFNVCYSFQSFDDLTLEGVAAGTAGKVGAEVFAGGGLDEAQVTSKFDLTLFVIEQAGSLHLSFEYSTELLLPESVRGYLTMLLRFLGRIAAAAGRDADEPPLAVAAPAAAVSVPV